MKLAVTSMLFAACLLGSLCAFGVEGSASHPIGKVIKLIEGLQEEVKEEGKEEALENEKVEYWCSKNLKTLREAIERGEQEVAKLDSKIEAAEQQEAALQGEVGELKDELGELTAAKEPDADKRQKEADLYKKTSDDLKATIKAMADAIAEVKKSKPSLLNVDNSAVPLLLQSPAVHRTVARLQASADVDSPLNSNLNEFLEVAQRPTLKAKGDQVKHVAPYKFKSGNVIELLKSLKTNFEEELVAATTAETNAINAYELAKQARDEQIKLAEATKGEKSTTIQEIKGDENTWESDLKDVKADLKADKETLANTENTCATRAREWDRRCAVRDDELKAMTEAISILDKAGGVQTEAPTNPIPPAAPLAASAPSFLQIVSPREQALNLLRTAASEMHSKAMERLVAELTLRPNSPFDQVKNMIQKMIFRLMDEQKDEDKHKDWCDQEISKTSISEKDKVDKVADLTGKVDSAKARLQKLTADIGAADEMVAKLTAFMKEAVEVREIGKKENAKALKDAQQAQTAIADATAVLKDFYKKSGMMEKEAWEFVQRDAAPVQLDDPPPAPTTEYKGTPKANNIITLLDTTASEFSKMEADTRAQESTDQEDFEAEMKTSKIEKARRVKESEMKGIEKKNVVDKLAMLEKSRTNVKKELDMVKQYTKDLQPACVEGSGSYDDRKKARQQEADALRQAQDVLTDAFKAKKNASLVEYTPPGPKKARLFLQAHRHLVAEQ